MEQTILLRAGLKRHRGGLAGIFVLVLLISLSLGTVLTVWRNAGDYVTAELARAGFGDVTAWVSGAPDTLAGEIAALPEVEKVEPQQVIFSNYEVRGQESDSEGQLITFEPGRYRFFGAEPAEIAPGAVYVSPSLVSMFGVEVGDAIDFPIARAGGIRRFTVAGFYEDPFMGSSMIGMKGFLIGQADHDEIAGVIAASGIDALGRDGEMLHIFGNGDLTTSELNRALNENTSLPQYTEFVHSFEAIRGFMLILQNAFSGMLLAFVLVLLAAVLAVLGHSIGGTIQEEYVNMGILKTVGLTSGALRRVQLLQYAAAILPAMALGLVFTPALSRVVADATLTTTGLRIPANLPVLWCAGAFGLVLLLLGGFILLKTAKIGKVTPMKAIRGGMEDTSFNPARVPGIHGNRLALSLAARQVLSGKRKYVSSLLVALLLVFFAATVGRVDGWLGPDGKGMMDAFNPADHDLGIQCFGTLDYREAEQTVLAHSEILDHYVLAMPGVALGGVDFTANVLDEPERFHILEGRACTGDDEIVITEFIAADFGLSLGDLVTVASSEGSGEYTVTGLYSCANDLGDTIGMSREGYLKIGADDPQLWCHHYFLSDPGQKTVITEELETAYGGDVHVHENTWPGLAGILAAMDALLAFLYGMTAAFILVVTVITGNRLLRAERRDTGIYQALGFTSRRLRASFALRFGMVALLGAALGTALAAVLTDPLVSAMLKLAGISNFASRATLANTLLPAGIVVLLFTAFAYLAGGGVKKTDLTILISE